MHHLLELDYLSYYDLHEEHSSIKVMSYRPVDKDQGKSNLGVQYLRAPDELLRNCKLYPFSSKIYRYNNGNNKNLF